MTVLNWHLAHWGFRFNDGKLIGPLWRNMGFREIPRRDFLARLAEAVRLPAKSGRWQVEADLATVSHWQPQQTAATEGSARDAVGDRLSDERNLRDQLAQAASASARRRCAVSGIAAGGTG